MAQVVCVAGIRDRSQVRFPLEVIEEVKYFHFFALVSRLSASFSSVTQHAMPPEFGEKWEAECLNTKLSAYHNHKKMYFYTFYIVYHVNTNYFNCTISFI